MAKVLAIDYGDRHVGLAIGDTEEYYIAPIDVLSSGSFEDLFIQLNKLLNENHIDVVVIGYPLSMKGEKTDQTREVDKFSDELSKRIDQQIVLEDERLTSALAAKYQKGFLKKIWSGSNKNQIQKSSAVLILETYLDKKKNEKK